MPLYYPDLIEKGYKFNEIDFMQFKKYKDETNRDVTGSALKIAAECMDCGEINIVNGYWHYDDIELLPTTCDNCNKTTKHWYVTYMDKDIIDYINNKYSLKLSYKSVPSIFSYELYNEYKNGNRFKRYKRY